MFTINSCIPNQQVWSLTFPSTSNGNGSSEMGQLRGNITHYLIFFHFSRKIKESLECFPVKLNNLIHTLAQMTAISPAKSTSQAFSQESCMPGASRSIQRATVLGFSKKTSHVSFKTVILTLMSFDYISHFASLHTFFLIPCFFFLPCI